MEEGSVLFMSVDKMQNRKIIRIKVTLKRERDDLQRNGCREGENGEEEHGDRI